MSKKNVLIVGGGFAGLKAARTFANQKDVDVKLIDKRNYHLFQPLLYQVATAGLSPADISAPIRSLTSDAKNVTVYMSELQSVNLATKTAVFDDGEMKYDYLVMACGAKHSYFGKSEWEDFAPGLKTLEQATEIRRRMLSAFELAEKETNLEKQKELLTFVIVGAGPTGVELAGTIVEIAQHTLTSEFRHIDPSKTRVLLVEAGPRVLAAFNEELSDRAEKDLKEMGVEVLKNTRVNQITKTQVTLGDQTLDANTVIWAAGVEPAKVSKTLGVELDRAGRVIIEKDLSLKNHPEVFVIGDQANFTAENGKPLPGLASVAMQQGIHAAKNILADIRQQQRTTFEYFDKGQMATIGRKKAIVQVGDIKVTGFIAWMMWLFVHIYYLIGFKNKIFVLWQWTYAYFTFKRGARLIVEKEWRSEQTTPPLVAGNPTLHPAAKRD